MTHAEALRAVWTQVAAHLQADLDMDAAWLTRDAEAEPALRRAAGAVLRIAEQCAASRSGSRTKGWWDQRMNTRDGPSV